jgi:hypothetical protein
MDAHTPRLFDFPIAPPARTVQRFSYRELALQVAARDLVNRNRDRSWGRRRPPDPV